MTTAESLEDIHELVRGAIRNRKPISARYQGYERKLCPHVLGWNLRGRLQVLCYQYGGGSRRGLAPEGNWRCIQLEELSDAQLLNESWRTAAIDDGQQSCVAAIEMVLEDWPTIRNTDSGRVAEAGGELS